jgi:hypothetical protein
MGKVIELVPSITAEDVVLRKGEGFTPDFKIYTAGIESDRTNNRLVHMVGSSTEQDMQGDVMTLYALNDMTKAAPNMTIWLNHNYDLPDSIFGSVVGTPAIKHQNGVADLHLSVDVELDNPSAARVKRYIDNGRRLGCSIGCMVTKYEVPDASDGPDYAKMPIKILGVYVVEYSVVGIPCNQRSWVENAISGVFTRTLDPHLAPAMKALWPSRYKALSKGFTTETREQMDMFLERERPDSRLEWHIPSKQFLLTHQGKEKFLAPDAVKSLFAGDPAVSATTRLEPDVVDDLHDISAEDFSGDEREKALDEEAIEQKSEEAPELDKVAAASTPEKKPAKTPDSDNQDGEDDAADQSSDDDNDADSEGDQDDDDKDGKNDKKPQKSAEEVIETASPDIETKEADLPAPTEPEVQTKELPAHTLAMLESYNTLGKALNMPEWSPEAYTKAQEAGISKHVSVDGQHMHHLQILHDMVKSMSGGMTCGESGQSFSEASNQAAEISGQTPAMGPMYNALGEHVMKITKSVEVYAQFAADIQKAQADRDAVLAEVKKAQSEVSSLYAELNKYNETVAALKDMPLGNPIHHKRSVHEDKESTVTREELLGLGAKPTEMVATDSLAKAFELTRVDREKAGGMFMEYRYWPAGVGGTTEKGVRPPLTTDQITFMSFADIEAYRAGKEAKVPHLDNQIAR